MEIWWSFSVFLLTFARGAAVSFELATFRCHDSMDCELNGECHADGHCSCAPGWVGVTCGTLDLLPAKRAGAWPTRQPVPPQYWGDGHTPCAWGGSVLRSDDGQFHIFAASGCYIPQRVMHMDGWQIVHAVGKHPAGPYTFVGKLAHTSATAFNPHATRLPDGRFLLYHVGSPTQPSSSGYSATCTGNESAPLLIPRALPVQHNGTCSVKDCFNQNCQPQQGSLDSACTDAGCVLDPGFGECYPPTWNSSASIHVAIADSAYGPWRNVTQVHIDGLVAKGVPEFAARLPDNPSPLVLQDKSSPSGYRILLAFRFPGNDSWCGKPRCAPSVIGLAEATQWDGPYVSIGKPTWPAPGAVLPYDTHLGCEDPTLFRGLNGSLHMLVHKYEDGAAPGWPGLHAFSADGGQTWNVSRQLDGRGAYSYEVEWADAGAPHSSTRFSRRERPELHVDAANGAPLFLATGVQLAASDDNGPGNDHRYSYTLVQMVRQAKNAVHEMSWV